MIANPASIINSITTSWMVRNIWVVIGFFGKSVRERRKNMAKKKHTIVIDDSIMKMRCGDIVAYNVDYLLKNLAREIYLLEASRHFKTTKCDKSYDEICKEYTERM